MQTVLTQDDRPTQLVTAGRLLDEGAYVIELEGELDLHTSPQFERSVLEAIDRGATDVVVDLQGVSFVDSTTIGVLMRARKRLASLRGRLLVVCSDRNLLKLFEITALDRMFEIFPSQEEALTHVDGRS